MPNDIEKKQDILVSGENIKTINGESILGGGNIIIEGGGSGSTVDQSYNPESGNAQSGVAVAKAVQPKIEWFKPETSYKPDDIVIGNWYEEIGGPLNYYTVIAMCINYCTSDSDSSIINLSTDKSCWKVISEFQSLISDKAVKDYDGNIIHTTYATKETLNSLISAGLKREIIDNFPRFDDSDSSTIYMKKSDSSEKNNYYDEYLIVGIESFDNIDVLSVRDLLSDTDVSDTEIDFVSMSIDKIESDADYIDLYVSSYHNAFCSSYCIRIDSSNFALIELLIQDNAKYMTFDFHYKNNTLTNMRIYNIELIGSTAVDLENYVTKEDLSTKMDKFGEVEKDD